MCFLIIPVQEYLLFARFRKFSVESWVSYILKVYTVPVNVNIISKDLIYKSTKKLIIVINYYLRVPFSLMDFLIFAADIF